MRFVITEGDKLEIISKYKELINEQGNPLIYTSVMDIPNTSKEEIYDRTKLWVAENFDNVNQIIQLDDKNNGIIVIKTKMQYTQNGIYCGWINYTVKILIKDNKVKIEMKDMVHSIESGYTKGPVVGSYGLLTDNPEPFSGLFANKNNKIFGFMKNGSSDYFKRFVLSLTEFLKTKKEDDFEP